MEVIKGNFEPKNLSGFAEVLLRGASKTNAEQIKHANIFIKKYNFRKKVIKKYRDLYPNGIDFFKICFGSKPRGKIEIVNGDTTLHLCCYDVEDYVLAYSFHRVRGETDKLNEEKKEWYAKTVSAALLDVAIPELSHIITIENVSRNLEISKSKGKETEEDIKRRLIEYSERARIHEEQHQLNKLFIPKENGEHEDLLNGLRDEVLALYRGGRNNAEKIYEDLVRSAGIYAQYFRRSFGEEVSEESYGAQLREWLSALTCLEQKRYSGDEVLAFLYWHPISRWTKVCDTIPKSTSRRL